MVVHPIATSPDPGAPARRLPWLALLLITLGAAIVGVAWLAWEATSTDRALRNLPTTERALLYQRTMEDLRTLCAPPRPEALRQHCLELAAVVAPLEECRDECQAIIRPILTPPPTR